MTWHDTLHGCKCTGSCKCGGGIIISGGGGGTGTQGPQGPQGPAGSRGSQWFFGPHLPPATAPDGSAFQDGDVWVDTTTYKMYRF